MREEDAYPVYDSIVDYLNEETRIEEDSGLWDIISREKFRNFIETAGLRPDGRAMKAYLPAAVGMGLMDLWWHYNFSMDRFWTYMYLFGLVGVCAGLTYPALKKEKKLGKLAWVAHTEFLLIAEDFSYWILQKILREHTIGNPFPVGNWWFDYFPSFVIPHLGHIGEASPYLSVPWGYILGFGVMAYYLSIQWEKGRAAKELLKNGKSKRVL